MDVLKKIVLAHFNDCLKLRCRFLLKIETKKICDIRRNCVVIYLLPEILKYALDFET